MKEIWNVMQMLFAALGGVLSWFFGGFDGMIYVLLTFIVCDYITGVMCAVLDKKLSSEIGYKGIFKKVMIFILVGVGHLIDAYIVRSGNTVRTAVVFFYVSNEGISLLENSAHMGLPVPQKIQDILAQIKEKSNEGSENKGHE